MRDPIQLQPLAQMLMEKQGEKINEAEKIFSAATGKEQSPISEESVLLMALVYLFIGLSNPDINQRELMQLSVAYCIAMESSPKGRLSVHYTIYMALFERMLADWNKDNG